MSPAPEDGATFDSHGSFSLDLDRARDKQAGRLFPSPHHWLLRVVQLAHQLEATALHLRQGVRSTTVSIELAAPLADSARLLAQTRLLEARAALAPGWQGELSLGGAEVRFQVTRPWLQALRRLDELRLLHQRCWCSEVPITIDRRPFAATSPPPHHAAWFDRHSLGQPQWLGELQAGSWPTRRKPNPLLPLLVNSGQPACRLAVSASLQGPNGCFPLQHGVLLEPVDLGFPDVGASLVWRADHLSTDLSGFRLTTTPLLEKQRQALERQLEALTKHCGRKLNHLQVRLRSRDEVSLSQFFGLVGGGVGFAAGGPVLALTAAALAYKVTRALPSDDTLSQEWGSRLAALRQELAEGSRRRKR